MTALTLVNHVLRIVPRVVIGQVFAALAVLLLL